MVHMIGNIIPVQASASLAQYAAAERNAQASPKNSPTIEDSVQISKAASTSATISEIIKGAANGDVDDLAKLTLIG
jgi:hypothetical protein